jgi:dienelactone hydrolase
LKSFVKAEDCNNIGAPLYIGLAGNDEMVPQTLHNDLLSWVSRTPGIDFMIETYQGMTHGFAARPNTEDALTKTEFEKAFDHTVHFLRKHA